MVKIQMAQKNPLFDFYKERYFHEIEVREHLSSRVQIPLAIIVPLTGVLAYILLNIDGNAGGKIFYAFRFFLILNVVALAYAAYFLVRSWIGQTYAFLPSAGKTEEYRLLLDKTYRKYKNCDDLVKEHLYKSICDNLIYCSTRNTACNDKRSVYLHKANVSLVVVNLCTASAFAFFYFGSFEKTQSTQPINVNIMNLQELKNARR